MLKSNIYPRDGQPICDCFFKPAEKLGHCPLKFSTYGRLFIKCLVITKQ